MCSVQGRGESKMPSLSAQALLGLIDGLLELWDLSLKHFHCDMWVALDVLLCKDVDAAILARLHPGGLELDASSFFFDSILSVILFFSKLEDLLLLSASLEVRLQALVLQLLLCM